MRISSQLAAIFLSEAVTPVLSHSGGGGHLHRHSEAQTPIPADSSLSIEGISYSTRAYWMRMANEALYGVLGRPCPFAAFGTVIVNHTGDGLGDLVCMGANSNKITGNPSMHGEMAAISNCSGIFMDPEGPYKMTASESQDAFTDLSLYTNAESCPMCASAIRWAGFKEYIYGTSIDTLIEKGWGQIRISSIEVFRQSFDLGTVTSLIAEVLTNETDPYFFWQYNPDVSLHAHVAAQPSTPKAATAPYTSFLSSRGISRFLAGRKVRSCCWLCRPVGTLLSHVRAIPIIRCFAGGASPRRAHPQKGPDVTVLDEETKNIVVNSKIEDAPHALNWMSTARSTRLGHLIEAEGKEKKLDDLLQWSEDKVCVCAMVWTNPAAGEKSLQIHGQGAYKLYLKDGPDAEEKAVADLGEMAPLPTGSWARPWSRKISVLIAARSKMLFYGKPVSCGIVVPSSQSPIDLGLCISAIKSLIRIIHPSDWNRPGSAPSFNDEGLSSKPIE
ncbi:hypothetical protein MKZ38_003039 [Zalerion maritima]|uniref:CMP/dCMP-type deaminase domain-containing protein n=1 Tax=Zalerion maritima TaxID=339359 RepID=A0AAD5RPI5_9PEZI|nr:hypothetical protein MKZ38_003039 [Zalerion maritima]